MKPPSAICAPSRVTLDVNLDAIADNYHKIADSVRPLGVVSVLKANAYGLGMPDIARELVGRGSAGIATASLAEALDAQAATGGGVPVLILGTVLPDELEPAIRAEVRLPLASLAEAKAASALAVRLRKTVRCHVALDTGMSRVGVSLREAAEMIPQMAALPNLEIEGMYSHFPTAGIPRDAPTAAQVRDIKALVAKLAKNGVPIPVLHLANSDGVNNVPAACRAPFTHVRVGLDLYGAFDPAGERLGLRPVLTFRARLAQVRRVPADATIGYGRTFTCPREMLVGTVAAGYADGLPFALSNRGSVLVHGVPCPVVGRVCMDFTTLDLAQVPDAQPGDEVVCLGRQGANEIPVNTWAALKGSHPHDILCAIGPRVKRNYVRDRS